MYRPHREQARSHRFQWCPQISRPTPINCGSGLARDSEVSVNINAGCTGLIASKLAPTGFSGVLRFGVRHKSTVGAGLPAIAEGQSTSMPDVPASSRASSLPQVSVVSSNFASDTDQLCGLARDSGGSVAINAGCTGLIASKLAPTGFSGVLRFRVQHRSTVGAGLPAIAVGQSTSMLAVPASSRASSLPQAPLSAFGKSLA